MKSLNRQISYNTKCKALIFCVRTEGVLGQPSERAL